MFFEQIISSLANIIIYIISNLGYLGVILAMAIESACIPLPSEIIMPFTGFLIAKGVFNFWWATLAGALGCLLGSLLAFFVGFYKGEEFVRFLIRRHGKYFLVFEYELDEAKEWFAKHGELITFTSRLMPVARTFISLPAGISGMNWKTFALYTFIGSLLWSAVLAYLGQLLGNNWESLGVYFRQFDLVIVFIGVLLVIFYVRHKLRKHHRYQQKRLKKHDLN